MSKSPQIGFANVSVQQLAINPDPTATIADMQLPSYTANPVTGNGGGLWFNSTSNTVCIRQNDATVHLLSTQDYVTAAVNTAGSNFYANTTPLNSITAPTGNVAMASNKITGLTSGTATGQAVSYDGMISYVGTQIPSTPSMAFMTMTAAATTTIATAGTFVKLAGTFGMTNSGNFASTAQNRFTWTGAYTTNAILNASISLILPSLLSTNIRVAIVKNGTTRLGPSSYLLQPGSLGAALGVTAIPISTAVSMTTNDYLEIWVSADALLGVGNTLITPSSVFATIISTS